MLILRKHKEFVLAILIAGSLWLGLVLTRGILTTNDSLGYYSGFLNFENVGGMRGYVLPAVYSVMPSGLFIGIFNIVVFIFAIGFFCQRLRGALGTDRWILIFSIVSPALTINSVQWSAYVMAHSGAIALGLIALGLVLRPSRDATLKGSVALGVTVILLSDLRPGSISIAAGLAAVAVIRSTELPGNLRDKVANAGKRSIVLILALAFSWWNLSTTSEKWEPIDGELALLPYVLQTNSPLTEPYVEELRELGAPDCLVPDELIPPVPARSDQRRAYQTSLASCDEGVSWFDGRHARILASVVADDPKLLAAQLRYTIDLTWVSAEFQGGYSLADPLGALWFGNHYDPSRMTLLVGLGLVASALLALVEPRRWRDAILCPTLVSASLASQLLFSHRASPRMYVDHNVLILVTVGLVLYFLASSCREPSIDGAKNVDFG